jgi:hypothetical protein
MNGIFLEFADCPCGHSTPIRPSRLVPSDTGQRWKETDTAPLLVACNVCKRVYKFEANELVHRRTVKGVGPYDPAAPTCVFQVRVGCDGVKCDTLPLVFVELSSNTTDEQLQAEKAKWRWVDLACASGHPIPWPQR